MRINVTCISNYWILCLQHSARMLVHTHTQFAPVHCQFTGAKCTSIAKHVSWMNLNSDIYTPFVPTVVWWVHVRSATLASVHVCRDEWTQLERIYFIFRLRQHSYTAHYLCLIRETVMSHDNFITILLSFDLLSTPSVRVLFSLANSEGIIYSHKFTKKNW